MGAVCPYVDRILAVADLEAHQMSITAPKDVAKAEQKHEDFPAACLFTIAALKELTTYPIVKYTPKFTVGEGGVEVASEAEPSCSKKLDSPAVLSITCHESLLSTRGAWRMKFPVALHSLYSVFCQFYEFPMR
jgi:hypothetical protein